MMKKKRKKKTPEGTPEEIALFKNLCLAVNELGIETRIERGKFRGGICKLEGEQNTIFINKKHPIETRIAMIIAELKKLNNLHTNLPDSLKKEIKDWF